MIDPRAIAVCRKDAKNTSPRHRKILAEAEIAERKNRQAAKAEEERFVEGREVEVVAEIIVSKLQALVGKVASELQLPPGAMQRFAASRDESREELSMRIFKKRTLDLPPITIPAAA